MDYRLQDHTFSPLIERLLPVTGFKRKLFQKYTSKVSGIQVHATKPEKKNKTKTIHTFRVYLTRYDTRTAFTKTRKYQDKESLQLET